MLIGNKVAQEQNPAVNYTPDDVYSDEGPAFASQVEIVIK